MACGWAWVECGQGSNVSVDEVSTEKDCVRSWCALSVDVLVSVLNVQCHASGEVRCSVVISVVIGICLIELPVPLFVVHFVVLILLVVILYQCIPLFPVSIFHICFHCILTAFQVWYSHTPSRLQQTTVSCKRSNWNKATEFEKLMPWRSVPISCLSGCPDQSVLGTSPWWLS